MGFANMEKLVFNVVVPQCVRNKSLASNYWLLSELFWVRHSADWMPDHVRHDEVSKRDNSELIHKTSCQQLSAKG